jgi:hypothetical protein
VPVKSILCAHDPALREWQLPLVRTGTLSLIGWRTDPISEREDGLPEEVADVLAKALTELGRVSFPCSEPVQTQPGDSVQVRRPRGLRATLLRLAAKEPPVIHVVSTRRSELTRHMFDDAGFPWWLQGQIGLVRSADATAPFTDLRMILEMIENADAPNWVELQTLNIQTIVRPGVDGGVMGLYNDSVSTRTLAIETLERCAKDAGYTWLTVSEPQFTDAVAEPWP